MVLTRIRGSQWTTCPTPREQLRRLRASRGAIVSLLGECQSAGGAEDAIDWDLWAIEARRWCVSLYFLVVAIGCICFTLLSRRPYNLAVGWMATRVGIAPRGVPSDWVASAPH